MYLIYLKALENELIPDVATLSFNLDIPTSQHCTFCKKWLVIMTIIIIMNENQTENGSKNKNKIKNRNSNKNKNKNSGLGFLV